MALTGLRALRHPDYRVYLTARAFPIGAFLTGTVAEHWGVTAALAVNGTAGLAATAAVALWWRTRGGRVW
jgi:hypothetical protein